MKVWYSAAILLGVMADSSPSHAQQQEITASCSTRQTVGSRDRLACTTAPTVVRAPAEHVFVEKSAKGGRTRGYGSAQDCRLSWSDPVEVLPGTGIAQPTAAILVAHARAAGGRFSVRGWVECKYTFNVVKYTR